MTVIKGYCHVNKVAVIGVVMSCYNLLRIGFWQLWKGYCHVKKVTVMEGILSFYD